MKNQKEKLKLLEDDLGLRGIDLDATKRAMKELIIELPSWAVGNSGTRYGTFRDKGSARNIWDKIDDCAEIQRVLGVSPVMASHVLWDVTDDGQYLPVRKYAEMRCPPKSSPA
ncbi:MAG: hypothetical protein Q8S22_02945 [Eubacteriales bacterium]|nr:hypothetical protein [Eubacteriales bacterium]